MNLDKILDYYNQCYIDYRLIWKIDKTLCIHFGFYDRNHKRHEDAVINMNRVLAKISKINSSDKILDVGCGIGESSIWIGKNFNSDVTGININKIQVEMASGFARKNNVDDMVKFHVRNFMDTKFPKNSFDVIWGLESICYAKNKKRFLSEAKRILKNKGRIIIADGFLKRKNLSSQEKNYMGKWLKGWAVPNLVTFDEFKKYLEDLGFRNIKFREITENVMPSSRRLYLASLFTYPIGKLLQWINVRTKIQTENMISAYYQHITIKKGLWGYGIFYAEK